MPNGRVRGRGGRGAGGRGSRGRPRGTSRPRGRPRAGRTAPDAALVLDDDVDQQRRPALQLHLERHDLVEQVGQAGLEPLELGAASPSSPRARCSVSVGADLDQLVAELDHRGRDLVGLLDREGAEGHAASATADEQRHEHLVGGERAVAGRPARTGRRRPGRGSSRRRGPRGRRRRACGGRARSRPGRTSARRRPGRATPPSRCRSGARWPPPAGGGRGPAGRGASGSGPRRTAGRRGT